MAGDEATVLTASWSELVDWLAEDLADRWRAGECPAVETYLARYPDLANRPDAAVELIYEELCLRKEHGRDTGDVLARFPQWRGRLEAVLACHQLLEADGPAPRFPGPGEWWGGFRLVAELGRGGVGRVFLATEAALADRPVVLKFTPRAGGEHLALARLQHTHIVPLYAVHEDPARDLRALCMPYFGGVTLARLLEGFRGRPPAARTGRELVEALRQPTAGVPLPVAGPACQFLRGLTYPQAVCWMGACLADALQFAHDRDLVHLDLKPANVLWAADGQPMLLDLHLARPPLAAGAEPPSRLGGTLAYLAPEQRRALEAVAAGAPIPGRVDGRADVYALGLLLCEALGGALPENGAAPGTALRHNPAVSVGLADLVGRCLAADPAARYPTAAAVAADLRRHLADLPLRGVPNRSAAERWHKWRRRRPHGATLLALGLAALAGGVLGAAYVEREADQARAALREGVGHLERRAYAPARAALERGLAGAATLPGHGDLAETLRTQLDRLRRAEAAQELHQVVERVRGLYGADGQPQAEVRGVADLCQAVWLKRHLIVRQLGTATIPEREQVRTDLLDLAALGAALRVRLAAGADAHREALKLLDEAEVLVGPNCVLASERQAHAAALGLPAAPAAPGAEPRTAWEHFAVGRADFLAGRLDAAAARFDQALALEPRALWAQFYSGACAYQRGRHEDAVLAFTACTVLAPEAAWGWYNRGLAYAAGGQPERALRDFDRALAAGMGSAPIHYQRALVHLRRGDRAAARASVAEALAHDAGHEAARALAAELAR